MRTISEKECSNLKGATEAGLAVGGGMTSFIHFTRVGVANLSKYASPHDEQFMPIDIAVEADRRAGTPVILAEMARQLGYELVPIAKGDQDEAPHQLTDADIVDLLMETFDLVRAIRTAGGRIDELSRKRISKAAHKLKRLLGGVSAAIARAA
ncbi:hypothetical protein [Sinorhizobium americanum]|uniref:Phage protein n=1 Tax=Sinorhizobium americanum TaxID=194963 RepID=A0A4R2BRQ7_9HYPH|nr:hypothetical protein [Sinorhizobium americanum]TCN30311.1 hypothetical protein EV184_108185 [Sinorhizobium americanum]